MEQCFAGAEGALRRFFEVDAEMMAFAALVDLGRQGVVEDDVVKEAQKGLGIDAEKVNPATL